MKKIFLFIILLLIMTLLSGCNHTNTTEENASIMAESIETDIYEGEYNDYDVDEPNLEIKKNEDGSYLIQIGIYRLTLFDNCIGKRVENGLEFSTPEGVEPYATGIITFDGDIATVTFMEPFWFSAFSDVNEYKYHKTSDIPNICARIMEEIRKRRLDKWFHNPIGIFCRKAEYKYEKKYINGMHLHM